MKKLTSPALLLCLLFPLSLYAATFDPSLKYKTITTRHFDVHYGEQLEVMAQKTAVYLEEAHEILSPELNWVPLGRTQVVLTDNYDTANGLTTTVPYNWIWLRVTAPNPNNVLASYDNWLRTLIIHEYTHVLHIDQCHGVMKIPRYLLGKVISPNGAVTGWIREGTATYTETSKTTFGRGRSSYAEMMLRTAIVEKKFPSLDEADGLGWKWPSYQSMYIYGVKFLEYLSDTYGEDKLMELYQQTASSPFFFMVNRHARTVFNKIDWESKKVNTHYTKFKRFGAPKTKTYYNFWDEWKKSLEKKYKEEAARLESYGFTQFEIVAAGEDVLSNPIISQDGKYLAYARSNPRGPAEIRLLDLGSKKDRTVKKKQLATSISFSPDGKKLIYSAIGGWKTYNSYSDVYEYDIETKKTERITKGLRASDPTYSKDGKKIALIKQEGGRSWLAIYNVESKEITDYKEEGSDKIMQFTKPSWSPDGKAIAVSSWQPVDSSTSTYDIGQWDIYLYDAANGKKIVQLTNDKAIDSNPIWSVDGKEIYYASDKDGISNIYRRSSLVARSSYAHSHESQATSPEQLTNVLTGVFQPSLSPDGQTLYVQYYNGGGFDIRKTVVSRQSEEAAGSQSSVFSNQPPTTNDRPLQLPSKKYSPFGRSLFMPRLILPNFAFLDNALYLTALTGSSDPLRWHSWYGGINYRSDLPSYIGYFFGYQYSRWKPTFSAGVLQYAVNFGTNALPQFCTAVDANGVCTSAYSKHYFEQRIRGYWGIAYPWKKQSLGLTYFYEDRDSNLTTAETNALATINFLPNLGKYSGFSLSHSYGQVEKYPASISNEKGRRLRSNFIITDTLLGSGERNEQRIYVGQYREYISLPWTNHVLAFKAHGGMTWGDEMLQGTFTMGGALGEGAFGGGDSLYYFPLRGLPVASLVGTRALLLSGEYRIPLASPHRGIGTWPIFLENIHLAPFADYGNTWRASTNTWGRKKYFFDNFLLGTGLELRGDFVVGHALPITGRIGYSVIVVNRDRLGNVKDPLLGTRAKNGILVLQLGTAF